MYLDIDVFLAFRFYGVIGNIECDQVINFKRERGSYVGRLWCVRASHSSSSRRRFKKLVWRSELTAIQQASYYEKEATICRSTYQGLLEMVASFLYIHEVGLAYVKWTYPVVGFRYLLYLQQESEQVTLIGSVGKVLYVIPQFQVPLRYLITGFSQFLCCSVGGTECMASNAVEKEISCLVISVRYRMSPIVDWYRYSRWFVVAGWSVMSRIERCWVGEQVLSWSK